jgi:hypothetical protein
LKARIFFTWTLSGVTFTDGATASGSFVYDADTHSWSDFSVSTTAGLLSAFTFDASNSGFYLSGSGPNSFILFAPDLRRYMNFSFDHPLGNGGGTHLIRTSNSYECMNCSPYRYVSAGALVSAPEAEVAEPGTMAAMGAALAALLLARRRRARTAI